jgi:predicted nucleic acid-binding protein
VPLVVDASVVVARLMGEEHPRFGHDLVRRLNEDQWIAPALWWFEVRNALMMNERRCRLAEEETKEHLKRLAEVPVAVDIAPDETAVMTLARRHRLTVYDAAYLELALREGLPLATLDASLAEAARREGVAVVGDGA